MSTNLKHLDVSRLHLPSECLCEILKTNHVLNGLEIHGCENVDEMAQAMIQALCNANATLCNVAIDGENDLSMDVALQLQYISLHSTLLDEPK